MARPGLTEYRLLDPATATRSCAAAVGAPVVDAPAAPATEGPRVGPGERSPGDIIRRRPGRSFPDASVGIMPFTGFRTRPGMDSARPSAFGPLTVPARRPPTGSRRRPAHRSAGPVRPAGGARRPGDSRFPSGAGNTSPRACAAILAAFLLSPISPAAQTEPIPPQLTLADALRIAEARNPAFRAARQGVDIREGGGPDRRPRAQPPRSPSRARRTPSSGDAAPRSGTTRR